MSLARERELKVLLAHPGFRAAVAAHALQSPDHTPAGTVHHAVHQATLQSQFAPLAKDIAEVAKHHANLALPSSERGKVTKNSVRYRPGSVAEHCGNCSMYRGHSCSLVVGTISPGDTCDRWEAKKEPSEHKPPFHHILKNARQAKDGNHYLPDPNRAGKYLMVVHNNSSRHAAVADGSTRHVLLIRHGSTHLNNQDTSVDRIRGWKDVPLNAEGKAQAEKTASEIAKQPPDHLVSSDMCRAKLTAEIIGKKIGIQPQPSQAFRPWNAGQLAGQLSKKAVPIMARYAEQEPDKPLPQGESFNSFRHRFFTGLHETLSNHPQGVVAVVSHHRNERLLHAWRAAGYPPDGQIDIKTFNQHGEPTGAAQSMEIPMDRLRAVAQRAK